MNRLLNVKHPNASELSQTDKAMFAMLRRNGLGASDAAVYLGLNKWTTVEDLIEEKCSIGLTDKEIEVGNKDVVRMGADLEPIILQKFQTWSGLETIKPPAMYELIEHPQLTINFDGIVDMEGTLIPVEAKFVSMYADRYWDKSKAIEHPAGGKPMLCGGTDITDHCTQAGQLYGIPAYYYSQVQQQMLGLEAPFCYLAAVFNKGWDFRVYKIFADKYTQDAIIQGSEEVWKRIQQKRGNV